MIRKAIREDLPAIKSLTEACAKALQAKNIFQWNENYPSREKLAADIRKNELYLWEEDKRIVSIMVLTSTMASVYNDVHWFTPNKNNLYVHRLATHPEYWGEGYARKMMDFAEETAKQNNCASIRLDTFSKNKRNLKFYEARGYDRSGFVYFPDKSSAPFYCYEKIM
ncbi:Ribosomal protein S18 acetylase RimI [Salegentibacter echinorum]|uniref:Ribosomal protein S18 acetylase RimI n=1 Tax=Salegentibacter echinorum TaxID=1073325 RepID=A0A1M5IL43_SALEC|nr:GNAT family N-acetyltransferase [Salegentibacter echinorum]SHG29032.1 Ribosomal protein S18 acetylase RimI [Salegentibacter echinorum]